VWERPERTPADRKVPRDEVDDAIADAMDATTPSSSQPTHQAVLPRSTRGAEPTATSSSTTHQQPGEDGAGLRPGAHRCPRGRPLSRRERAARPPRRPLRRALDPDGVVVSKAHPDSPRKIDAAVAMIGEWIRARTS